MTNLALGDLESLSYDFSVLDCPTSDADDICPEQFYVNIFLRKNEMRDNFYDCNMAFNAAGGGEENGGFTTVTVTPFTKLSSEPPNNTGGGPGCEGKTSLFEYLQEHPDAVLGRGDYLLGHRSNSTLETRLLPGTGSSGATTTSESGSRTNPIASTNSSPSANRSPVLFEPHPHPSSFEGVP